MRVLNRIKSELIVAVDIETVRVAENFEELDEGTQSAWGYKNKHDGKVPDNYELSELWKKTSSLYAEFSKICAVSLAYLDPQGRLVCKEFCGENEKELLQSLSVTLNNMQAHNSQYRLVGHASKFFDYPFTSKRFIINELDIPNCLDSTDLKPWEGMNLCTNDLWKCGGTGAGSSLQALCNVLKIPISKIDIVGDEVGETYYRGELQRISRYCSLDTIATFNVFRKFKKESIFQFNEVNYITAYSDEIREVEEVIKSPILIRVYNNKGLTGEDKAEMEVLLKSKEPTEEDKVNLKKIILSHYQAKSDKVVVKKTKEQEVNSFIESLWKTV